jgi:hypothetical protein
MGTMRGGGNANKFSNSHSNSNSKSKSKLKEGQNNFLEILFYFSSILSQLPLALGGVVVLDETAA